MFIIRVLGQVQVQQVKGRKVLLAHKVLKDHADLEETRAILGKLVLAGIQEKLVRRAELDHAVSKATRVILGKLDLQVLTVPMALKDHRGYVDSREMMAHKVLKDHRV
jgi:hypothetical protein